MPFYDYTCKNETCAHNWVEEQPIKAAPIETCPSCKKATAQRLISGSTQIAFKGKWFKTGGY